ncbi:carbon starvation protein A [Facklamia sp. DSM 111018]|uniref:Carbon starvation protein A n=1 Tax=Facklamia lactis TaxID=2749967 RepID=A0ABS0LNN3_9LACT|nr:carbon starvation protein A [Facklamia lactis]MBG9979556.1 carbon starvation protein A [Facklamia lactis]MBG9985775.1 carbon starvation protein A [Facklamia lactis]
MISFILSCIALTLGYFIYGKFAERVFNIDPDRPTPANSEYDGVDYVPLPLWKSFLIQFLNIAGTGPIFGAVAGAMWGPWAFIWIVFGNIFAGAVHDIMVGMMSVRSKGASISELVGENLGQTAKWVMVIFSIILLLLVGVVFVSSPADLLANLTHINRWWWIGIILFYYIIATILPIDVIIAKIYPVFGVALVIMAIGIVVGMISNGDFAQIPEFSFHNPHVEGVSVFPYVCISIACGAISGFHATQSPLIARTIQNEKEGRQVFYGAMIAEGFVALIWAAATMTFFGGLEGLAAQGGKAAVIVNEISSGLMGKVGMILAILGVVALPISSGDTAFRSIRLTIADTFKIPQKDAKARYLISLPLFAVAIGLLFIDFNIIWRYFSWSNQTLAMIALWAAAAYLKKHDRNYWVTVIPAMFMTVVVTSYITIAPEGFGAVWGENTVLAEQVGLGLGIALMSLCTFLFLRTDFKSEAEDTILIEESPLVKEEVLS